MRSIFMGRTVRRLAAAFGVGFFLTSIPVLASTLEEITALGNAGSLGLAIRLLERYQPPIEDDEQWVAWERERLNLYDRTGKLDLLIQRIAATKDLIPDNIARWLLLQAVHAYLAKGEGAGARRLLTELIWQEHGALNSSDGLRARRLLIRGLLYENQYRDALIALEDYQAEFGVESEYLGNEDWFTDQAMVYVLNNRLSQAYEILQRETAPRPSPLKLLVALRRHSMDTEQVLRECRRILDSGGAPQQASLYWAVFAEAAGALGHGLEQAHALEQSLTLLGNEPFVKGVYALDPDRLWKAYRQLKPSLSRVLGMGAATDDAAWFDAAARQQKKNTIYSRFIYAMLAMDGADSWVRDHAHQMYAAATMRLPEGDLLLQALYLRARLFPDTANLPPGVRHLLIDEAIKDADTPLASRLMRGLSQAPEGVSELDWKLRQARVHIMAGQHQQGTEVILGLLKEVDTFSGEQQDRLMQVLFDLQAVGEHRSVVPLFETVFNRTSDIQRRREILFWIADSMQEQKNYDEAARYYLKSATLADGSAMDLWAQSARFKAAEMLTLAGLPLDARKIYQELLRVTSDASQRSQLQRNIQQLAYRGQ